MSRSHNIIDYLCSSHLCIHGLLALELFEITCTGSSDQYFLSCFFFFSLSVIVATDGLAFKVIWLIIVIDPFKFNLQYLYFTVIIYYQLVSSYSILFESVFQYMHCISVCFSMFLLHQCVFFSLFIVFKFKSVTS